MNDKPTQQFQGSGQWRRASAAAVVIAAILGTGAATAVGVSAMSGPATAPSSTTSALFAGPATPNSPLVVPSESTKITKVEPAGERANIPQPVSPPVPLNATVTLAKGGKIRISSIEAVQGEAKGRGEVAGPSLKFQVTIDNPTDEEILTGSMLVNVESGSEKTPAIQLSGPGVAGFPASVAPRSSASATYVFNVAPAERERVRILFDYGLTDPIAVFEGAAGKPGA